MIKQRYKLIVIILILSGCKTLKEGQVIYKYNDGAPGNKGQITPYQLKESADVKVKEVKGKGFMLLDIDDNNLMVQTPLKPITRLTDWRKSTTDYYYLPDLDHTKNKASYRTSGGEFQAISVSFKNRFKTKGGNLDSIPNTWSSGFSPALSYTYAMRKHIFDKNGEKTTLSANIGGFLGFGTADIKKETTRPKYQFSRKALTIPVGGFVGFGYDKFNVGAGFGWEWATGEASKTWVYQGQPFIGIIFGYELIKVRD